MSKITEYDFLKDIKDDDVLLIDGPSGTHQVTLKDLFESDLFNTIINNKMKEISDSVVKLKEQIGKYVFHEPPLTQQEYDDMKDHGTEHDIYIVLEENGSD